MEEVIARLRRMGVLFLVGFSLIIYVGFALVYWQQISQRKSLSEQINRLNQTLSRQLPGAEKLQADYEAANRALVPLTVKEGLAVIVSIAEKHGIDVTTETNKLIIPPTVTISRAQVGGSSYQILTFNNVRVEGNYDNVMAFLADLDLGESKNTMLLKTVVFTAGQVTAGDEVEINGKKIAPEIKATAVVNLIIYTKPG